MTPTRSAILVAAAALAGVGCDKLGTPIEPYAVARLVEFRQDTLSVAGPGCTDSAVVSVKPAASQYTLRVKADTAFVDTDGKPHETPGWWWMQGRKPGVGRVIAYLDVDKEQSVTFTADTMYLKVGETLPTVTAVEDTVWLQPATSGGVQSPTGVRMSAFIRTACNTPLDPRLVSYTSSRPDVAAVDSAGSITPLRAGETAVRLRAAGTERTTYVRVRRVVMQPADTTVFVGDTVRFRMLYENDAGALVEDVAALFNTSYSTNFMIRQGGLVTATRATSASAPATIQGTVGGSIGRGWTVQSRVRVVARL